MKNIMVTGGCGFIGSNFIRYLLQSSGFEGRVINVDKLTYAGNQENLLDLTARLKDRYIFEQADITNAQVIGQIVDRWQVDAICHFAAESHVDRSIVRPDTFIQTNIVGTYVLLETARAMGTRLQLFHHVSTDEVYGSLGPEGAFTEETAYRPNSPYSASKAASDHLVRAYHKTYGMPMTISNCSNNYGPYQFPEKLIPLMILNAHQGKALPVYGDGRNVRDWLYVVDHCEAIWQIMQHGRRGTTYNIGGRSEMENFRLVTLLCDKLDELCGKLPGGPRRELIELVADRPGHDRRYAIDFSKLHNELGWQPRETFETGMDKTIRWYLDNPEWVQRVISGEYQSWMATQYKNLG